MSDRFPSINPLDPSVIATGHQHLFINGQLVLAHASGPQYRPDGSLLCTHNESGAPLDGAVLVVANGQAVIFHPPGLEGWSAHNGHFAGWARNDRLKAITISRSGHRAGLVDLGGSVILEVDGVEIDRGPIAEPRYTGEILVWSKIVDRQRRTFGRLAHGAPTEDLTALPADEFYPRAIETSKGVFVLNHSHPELGYPLFLRPWGSRQQRGYVVAHGITDRPDAIAVGDTVLVAFSNYRELVWKVVDLNAPMELLAQPSAPPPPPPPPPINPPSPSEPPNVAVQDVPNYRNFIEAVAAQYPYEWRKAHADYERQGQPGFTTVEEAEAFIRIAAYEINKVDSRIGLNGKRASNTLSQDALCFRHDDGRESVIDVINGAGGSNPTAGWNVVGHYRRAGDGQKWIQPQAVSGGGSMPTPHPTPTPTPTPTFTFPTGTEMPEDVALSVIDGYLAGIRERDKVRAQDTVPSRGALMYLFSVFFRELSSWIVEKKRAPQGVEWWQVRDRIVTAAVKHYQDRQGVD